MYSITAECAFDSAHFLKGYTGKCSNIHGHRWRVVCEVQSEKLEMAGACRGMLVDFGILKEALKSITDLFDHALIYEIGSLSCESLVAFEKEGFLLKEVPFRPTAECFSEFFYLEMEKRGFLMTSLTVFETPTNSATYRR